MVRIKVALVAVALLLSFELLGLPDAQLPLGAAELVAPAAWLKSQPAPGFRTEHTLPPLSRWGWTLDFETRVEFAESWGYCLELGSAATDENVGRMLSNPADPDAKLVAMAAENPAKYKLQVLTSRALPDNAKAPPETWTRTAAGILLNGQAKSLDGMVWTPGMQPVYSPETPDSVWKESGRLQAEPLRKLRQRCPIAVILNGGEYGMPVAGWAKKAWEQDPKIVKAKGWQSWADYGSKKLARSQAIIADAIKEAVPDRTLYVYYHFGGVPYRNSYREWKEWQPTFEDANGITDLPNSVAYYKEYNTGWTWEGDRGDLLTQALNARGQEIAGGKPLSYNWLCGGYKQQEPGMISDILLYTGFLKMYYTAGMVGGNAGYYEYPEANGARGFEAKFPANEPPPWIRQMVALARVHGQFTFYEHYLRDGDLLPGPNRHRWSKDQPAHEFPTGDPTARVVARKLRDKPRWLITAWAADGKERTANVTIPELGKVSVLARNCGTVHLAAIKDGKPVVKVVDAKDSYWLTGEDATMPPAVP